jgi:hypothetical protein
MKRILIITVLIAAFGSTALASNYEETMSKNIQKMYTLTSSSELVNLANQFQRIASVEKKEWLPRYYAAYCFITSTLFDEMSEDEKHQKLDMAQKEMDVLKGQAPDESEVYVLQAFLYQLRITDLSKGMKFSSLTNEALAVAEKLDSGNPRICYLRGTNIYYTPKMFGGGAEKAKPLFEKAAKMFETFQPGNPLYPSWGKQHNTQMLEMYNQGNE